MIFLKRLTIVFSMLMFTVFCLQTLKAQTVSGKWYGIGNVDIPGSTNNYMCEFIIKQKGSSVTGYMNYFFRDAYFTNKISGTYNSARRELRIKPVPILYHRSVNPGTGVDCIMTGVFTLKVSKAESTLTGSFLSDALHAYTAPPIDIKFRKLLKNEPELKERIVQKPLQLEETPTPVAKAKKPEPEVPKQLFEIKAEKQLQMRTKEIVRILDVSDDSVRVDLYDNADLDYDSVSVFFNNKLVQYRQLLDVKKPIQFYIPVDSVETNNDLVMFAENLGQIPPNSGLMIITDSTHRYEVPLTSTYQKNAAVRLRKVPATSIAGK